MSDSEAPFAPPPVIGLTTYLEQSKTGVWDVPASFLPQVYFDAVTRCGGIAVLLPPQPVSGMIVERVLESLDGLIVTGGKDLDPALYGQQPHDETDVPRPDRDAWETALLTGALQRQLPFLGICRGAQVLNVTLGGSLHQHLPDVLGTRRYQLGGGEFASVGVAVAAGSKLAGLLDAPGGGDEPQTLDVPVYHHQAIDRLGAGLRVTASTDDGVIEAVELEGAAFALAVQWHPEESREDLRLFAGLVEAAGTYARARPHPRQEAAS
ncbi:gamma-glutamyl-gamma-aminobutyrate hydrolase family protein [Subtercola boreus]|uniref:Gamma-glutamyl-gamma-aminobutyrate hydrolase n=1 Tax=Subtercola boreus TaxID=120213 RepID=A0A3E0WD00_9MICO|nr:gamma-glutamyl-gamma-aminobutyrate hydrolase family protein [Subtercola boreus]RFA22690.1 gamma-glutamyl-gamma-aminobutyrate hydrolase [Subtercola boreus]RFA23045.1 gamma-glutamyl-gamma-aminobutyrate hydrolase [Subtercola boreus]RFA28798.1 gamma-glutamyl-gamma-aminobutyrate hydrolase [Subtercola boreus]